MSALEELILVATSSGDVMAKARELIGADRLALLIAKAVLSRTSLELHPTDVADVLKINRNTAANWIAQSAVGRDRSPGGLKESQGS